jgi:hypothetical protein
LAAGGLEGLSELCSSLWLLTALLKFLIPSPKDFPSSGSLLAPKITMTISSIINSSGAPKEPNIKASFRRIAEINFIRLQVKNTIYPDRCQGKEREQEIHKQVPEIVRWQVLD